MSARTSRSRVTALEVDDAGLLVTGTGDFPLDVCFDDRRIFSFWLTRDTVEAGEGRRRLPWPPVLKKFLDGRTTVTLVDPVDGGVLVTADAVLGSGDGEIEIVDGQGNPMGLDKSLRLTRLFGSRDPEQMVPLLDAIETVLGALDSAGLKPFLAYGTLLGAVRDQDFIGHDSDADLGYVSDYDHPVDAILESFRFQRRIQELGYRVHRYSGLAFKVTVEEADGAPRGLDVFGGFVRDGMLYLMGEVGHPFKREWLDPRSEVTLAGRTFPAPAVPERLLEAMYGTGWKVPDPAYKFTTPASTQRRLNGWFRGIRVGYDAKWGRVRAGIETPKKAASGFVKWVAERETEAGRDLADTTVIDVGCGHGRDTVWMGERGANAIGLDYFPHSFRWLRKQAAKKNLPVRFEWTNFNELRSVLATGTGLAREPGPRIMIARHVVDATDRNGRRNLLRLAKMATRDNGRLYLQFQARRTRNSQRLGINPVPPEAMVRLVEESGGTVDELAPLESKRGAQGDAQPTIFRMVVSWTKTK